MGVVFLSVGIGLMPPPSCLIGLSGSRGIQLVANPSGLIADASTSSNCVVNPIGDLSNPDGDTNPPNSVRRADIIGLSQQP